MKRAANSNIGRTLTHAVVALLIVVVLVCPARGVLHGARLGEKRTERSDNRGLVCISIGAASTDIRFGQRMELIAYASDTYDRKLTYSWSATRGSIEGEGSNVCFIAPSSEPGPITVEVEVSAGKGHTCGSSITLYLYPPPSRPPRLNDGAELAVAPEPARLSSIVSSRAVARAR
jgi:hypothetical protein